jgi:hypothetical protein
MSYSEQEARWEREEEIAKAMETSDSEALYQLAGLEKEEGNDEVAAELIRVARMIDNADWAYDNAIGN